MKRPVGSRASSAGLAPARKRASSAGLALARRLDGGVLLAGVLLIGIGVVMSYSTTAALDLSRRVPPLFLAHVEALALGLSCATLAMLLPVEFWRRAGIPLWCAAVVLLAATAVIGTEVNGAQRWLEIPFIDFRFQAVEPAKYATVLAVASLASRREGRGALSGRRTLMTLALAGPPAGLLLLQPDLGNAVVVVALVAMLLFAAGAAIRHLLVATAVGIAGIAAYVAHNPYALDRVTGFLDPWSDPQGSGFQLVQSFVAFSNGGLTGVGLGDSRQKLFYLPEGHTDFILALVAEELGLIGVLLVLGAFAALLVAGTRIARRAGSRFELLTAFGMTALLTAPALVNAAVVMGMLPTKGLTLPLLSYGGTSLVVSCTALGTLLSVARVAPLPPARPTGLRRLAWR